VENDLFELIRNEGGDLVERVECIDVYKSVKLNKESRCYRIFYRSLERTVENKEIDVIQENLRESIKTNMEIVIR
jgi:phenylalanyl-tRNA synthetase alpha chain